MIAVEEGEDDINPLEGVGIVFEDKNTAMCGIRGEDRRRAVGILFPASVFDFGDIAGEIEPAAFFADTEGNQLIFFVGERADNSRRRTDGMFISDGGTAEEDENF